MEQGYKYSMILNEIYEASPSAYQDLSQDNSQPTLNDTRKTRLTLGHINKLRLMNELRAVEKKQDLKRIRKQYAAPAQPGPGM